MSHNEILCYIQSDLLIKTTCSFQGPPGRRSAQKPGGRMGQPTKVIQHTMGSAEVKLHNTENAWKPQLMDSPKPAVEGESKTDVCAEYSTSVFYIHNSVDFVFYIFINDAVYKPLYVSGPLQESESNLKQTDPSKIPNFSATSFGPRN